MIFVLVVTLTASMFAPVASAASSEAQQLLSLINASRSRSGLSQLYFDGILMSTAQSHAQRMASSGRIYHNGSYPGGTGAYTSWGENVGSGPSVDVIHREFMASSQHRSNILKREFNAIGIGVARYSEGIMVVEDFLARPGGAPKAVSRPKKTSTSTPSAPPDPPPPPPEPPKPPNEIGKWIPVGSIGQMASLDDFDHEIANLVELHKKLASPEGSVLACRFDAIAPGPGIGTILVLTVCEMDHASPNSIRYLM